MNKKTTIIYYAGIGVVMTLEAIFGAEFGGVDIGYFGGLLIAPVIMWLATRVLKTLK